MKYIAITSKLHDGFSMYGSKVNKYNIVDATPFGRDPMKELAAACQKAGIRLCFYPLIGNRDDEVLIADLAHISHFLMKCRRARAGRLARLWQVRSPDPEVL